MTMTTPVTTFTVRFDERTKQILVSLLEQATAQMTARIAEGDYSEEALQAHEELIQVKRGILYSRPEEPEEPVVGPEAGINGGEGVEPPAADVTLWIQAGSAQQNNSWRN